MTEQQANMDPKRFGIYGKDADKQTTITYTRDLPHDIEKVWRAISEAPHRAAWFPELSLEHQTGGNAVVNFSGGECPAPEDNPSDVYFCQVTQFQPPHLLEYIGPRERHRFELTPTETGCRLTFMAILPDASTFDDPDQTIQSRYSVACGWHYKLDIMEWDLDGIPFEDEGYAGPMKTKYYFAYRKLDNR